MPRLCSRAELRWWRCGPIGRRRSRGSAPRSSEFVDGGAWVLCVPAGYDVRRSSALAIDVLQVDAYEVRDGQIIRAILAYPDKATALEAVAGLPE